MLELKHCHKKPSEPLVLLINGFLMYVCNKYSCIYAIVALNMQFLKKKNETFLKQFYINIYLFWWMDFDSNWYFNEFFFYQLLAWKANAYVQLQVQIIIYTWLITALVSSNFSYYVIDVKFKDV